MAELKRNRSTDERYRKKKFNDAPVRPDIRKSIAELRAVYSSLTDSEFAAWYNKRYSIPINTVLNYLEHPGGGHDRNADTQ